jgi:hypothetical protein
MTFAAAFRVHEIDAVIGGIIADKTVSREVTFLRLDGFEKSLDQVGRQTFLVVAMVRLCGLVIGDAPAAQPEIITPKENHHDLSAT